MQELLGEVSASEPITPNCANVSLPSLKSGCVVGSQVVYLSCRCALSSLPQNGRVLFDQEFKLIRESGDEHGPTS